MSQSHQKAATWAEDLRINTSDLLAPSAAPSTLYDPPLAYNYDAATEITLRPRVENQGGESMIGFDLDRTYRIKSFHISTVFFLSNFLASVDNGSIVYRL